MTLQRNVVNLVNQPWVYIVLLGLIFIFISRVFAKPVASPANQPDMIKEMEQTIEHFAGELEEENQAMLQVFSNMKKEYEGQLHKLADRIDFLEKQSHGLSQELVKFAHTRIDDLTAKSADRQADIKVAIAPDSEPTRPANQASSLAYAAETVPQVKSTEVPSLMNMRERYEHVFQLFDQGKSTDYIAKKLKMNKGEVLLITQLARQEEQLRG